MILEYLILLTFSDIQNFADSLGKEAQPQENIFYQASAEAPRWLAIEASDLNVG